MISSRMGNTDKATADNRKGCGGSTARDRRHTSTDRDAGGDTAPVGPVIATAADRDVAVHIDVNRLRCRSPKLRAGRRSL